MTRRSGNRILDAAIISTRLRSAAKLGCGRGPAWLFFGVSWRDKLLLVVGVAQLVERRSVAPNVAGSIPVSHPNNLVSNPMPIIKFGFLFLVSAMVMGTCVGQDRYESGKLKGFTNYTAFEIVQISPPLKVRTIDGFVSISRREVPLADVLIEIRDARGKIRGTKTDARGHFKFRNVENGSYDFKTTLSGFSSVTGTFVVQTHTKNPDTIKLEMPIGV